MRSYPRNPKKVEKDIEVCPRCKVALIRIEKDGCNENECPICEVAQDGC